MPRLPFGESSRPEKLRLIKGSETKPYEVRLFGPDWSQHSCTCKAFEFGLLCKHVKRFRAEIELGHERETTTRGRLLDIPAFVGLLLVDCSCGAGYTVQECEDEFAALEAAHTAHVAEVTAKQGESDA